MKKRVIVGLVAIPLIGLVIPAAYSQLLATRARRSA